MGPGSHNYDIDVAFGRGRKLTTKDMHLKRAPLGTSLVPQSPFWLFLCSPLYLITVLTLLSR